MKGPVKALILIILGFTFLALFASEAPDGLERVAENLGVKSSESMWSGVMPDYTFPAFENPYASKLLAGIIGIFLVLGTSFALGLAISRK